MPARPQHPDIYCLGLIVADVIASPLNKLPRPGTLDPCEQILMQAGGCAVNTGSALARLSLRTGLIGAVGDDGFATYLWDELARRGLDLKGVRTLKGASTSASVVAVNREGERAFVHHVGANALLRAGHLDWGRLGRARHLHVGGSFLMPGLDGKPLAGVLRKARARGLSTSLDTVFNPALNWAKVLQPCLPQLDYFLPSLEEARQISGAKDPAKMARLFQAHGAATVVIKMGAQGSFVQAEGPGYRVPAPKIKVVDSTGAGDAFCAGFIAARLKGWSLLRSARFGNVMGASCCRALGAFAGLPGRQAAKKLLRQWYPE